MMFKKAPLALLSALILSSTFVSAEDAVTPSVAGASGGGKVHFQGSIINAPCTLSTASEEQTVRLDQVSSKTLLNNGTSKMKPFVIELQQCDASTLKKVKVTFGGDADRTDPTLLGIAGSAKGAGIVLTDGSGTQVQLGQASQARTLLAGDNSLTFGAFLKGTTAKDIAPTPGDFIATTNFVLQYE